VLGIGAHQAGVSATLAIAAAGLVLGPLAAIRWPPRRIDPQQLLPAGDWPSPQILDADAQMDGPVLVRVEYHPQPGAENELLAACPSCATAGGASVPAHGVSGASWTRPKRMRRASCSRHGMTTSDSTNAWRSPTGRQQRVRDLTDPERAPVVTHLITARTTSVRHPPTPVALSTAALSGGINGRARLG